MARGDRFDAVIASEVIEHVRRPDEFVGVLARLMRDSDTPPSGAGGPSGQKDQQASSSGGPVGRKPSLPSLPSLLLMSTINRTMESFAVAIVGAEYVTRMVPQGTHDWTRFLTPQEMALMTTQVCRTCMQSDVFDPAL